MLHEFMSWQRLQNQRLQEQLKIRSRIIQLIREFFIRKGFSEIETPILAPAAGQEPNLNPLKVKIWDDEGRQAQGYLITSPEYAHKKLLAGGLKKTFEITKCFRAGEHWGGLHNPEFTMLEWYRARASYFNIMDDIERLISFIAGRLEDRRRANSKLKTQNSKHVASKAEPSRLKIKNLEINYQGRKINLTLPWQRLSVQEAWEKYAKVKKHAKIHDREFLRAFCRKRGYTFRKSDSYDDLFFKIFLTEIEPKLGFPKPTILYDYPAQMAALARLKKNDSRWAERFEVYIAGIELANAFSELNDSAEQRRRFLKERKLREKLDKEITPFDEDFLEAVGQMPPSAGIAFGIDRLVMLLTDAEKIEEVLAFPAGEIFLAH